VMEIWNNVLSNTTATRSHADDAAESARRYRHGLRAHLPGAQAWTATTRLICSPVLAALEELSGRSTRKYPKTNARPVAEAATAAPQRHRLPRHRGSHRCLTLRHRRRVRNEGRGYVLAHLRARASSGGTPRAARAVHAQARSRGRAMGGVSGAEEESAAR
jgi:hypothetical protein